MIENKPSAPPPHAAPGDDWLDELFRAARTEVPKPNEAALDTWVRDARQAALRYGAPPQKTEPARLIRGMWAEFWNTLGGWPAGACMMTAAALGVVIGLNPPAIVDGFYALTQGDEGYLVGVIADIDLLPISEG